MIEKNFDIPFISDLALREKQIQQNYRPIIAVHKWFARRPGTLFRGLLLSEFVEKPLREAFYQSNQLNGRLIADPFMGGGTPLIEANRVGCDVVGFDINPMSYWIVKQEIEQIDLESYGRAADALRGKLEEVLGSFYLTQCILCGDTGAQVKYFLWIKRIQCGNCNCEVDLFPGYLLASNSRHPHYVFVCGVCGNLTETLDRERPGACQNCHATLRLEGPAKRNSCICSNCSQPITFPSSMTGPPQHRLFALEYHCTKCKDQHTGRYFKVPDTSDINNLCRAEKLWKNTQSKYVPMDEIPTGEETNRLLRWGYRHYYEMFNSRQLLGLDSSARLIGEIHDERIRNALATNFSDLLRYQNMLCRYDPVALKSLDIFSVHGFPVGLIQCESNLLGILGAKRQSCIGSGGWANIVEKYRKAKTYCHSPFEVKNSGNKKEIISILGEWISDDSSSTCLNEGRRVELHCGNAAEADLEPASVDAVITDPPYFGNVQYAELIDFCYVWLRRLVDSKDGVFLETSTRNSQELTINEDMGRGLDHFTQGLSSVFQKMSKALKPGAPLVFTYHHNEIGAYLPIAVAILDAGLTCSASIPCPAEMGASIHINGTGSSIIDTVFVCRSTGVVARDLLAASIEGVVELIRDDISRLRLGNVKPSQGDIRCIAYGHLIRLAIWNLRKNWRRTANITDRLSIVSDWLQQFGCWKEIERHFFKRGDLPEDLPLLNLRENQATYGASDDEVSF